MRPARRIGDLARRLRVLGAVQMERLTRVKGAGVDRDDWHGLRRRAAAMQACHDATSMRGSDPVGDAGCITARCAAVACLANAVAPSVCESGS